MLAKIHTETTDRTVDNLQQYDTLVKRLSRRYAANPPINMPDGQLVRCGNAIGITRARGDSLMVVIGGEEGYVSFQPASPEERTLCSFGDPDAEGTFVFFMDGHWTELSRRYAVSPADALSVARRFLQLTEGVPTGVVWVEPGD